MAFIFISYSCLEASAANFFSNSNFSDWSCSIMIVMLHWLMASDRNRISSFSNSIFILSIFNFASYSIAILANSSSSDIFSRTIRSSCSFKAVICRNSRSASAFTNSLSRTASSRIKSVDLFTLQATCDGSDVGETSFTFTIGDTGGTAPPSVDIESSIWGSNIAITNSDKGEPNVTDTIDLTFL